MTAPHFLVFVGASPSLSTELQALKNRFQGIEVVAPAVGRHHRGLTKTAVQRAVAAVVEALKAQHSHREPARLSVWSYEHLNQFQWLWDAFGKAAWIELIPATLNNKDRQTRLHMQNRLDSLEQLIHVIAYSVFKSRRASPLPLPLRNFRNKLTRELEEFWYRGNDVSSLKRMIERRSQGFRQLRTAEGAHRDDRALLFTGARDTECHGKPHPMGEVDICFVEGRFRFGATRSRLPL